MKGRGKDWGGVKLKVLTAAHPQFRKFVQEAAYKLWQNASYLNFFFSRKQQKPTYILWITCTWEISIKETVFPLLLLTDQQLTEASCSNVSFLFWSFPGRKLQLCYGNRNTLFKATLFQVICHKLKIILITSKWTCFVCQILSFPECLNNIRSRLTLKYAQGLLASC